MRGRPKGCRQTRPRGQRPTANPLPAALPPAASPPAASLTASRRSGGPLAPALAAATSWLLEPAEPPADRGLTAPALPRPVIAVFGLTRGCGATVVARALAAELARRDPCGAAAVHCDARTAGIPLATPAAGRLARVLAEVAGADTRAVGRLCLVGGADCTPLADTARHAAPLVLDAGASALGGVPAALADEVLVVGGPTTEPALATVAANCLVRLGHQPIVVLNRCADPSAAWTAAAAHVLPDSRMGAQLALGGREPRGDLGRAIAQLTDRCEGNRMS
jgi:hypothetical protein